MKKPVLVTGGCGFVGRHLIRALLTRGYADIWIIDNLSTGITPRKWLGDAWTEVREGSVLAYVAKEKKIRFIKSELRAFLYTEDKTVLPQLFGDVFHLASIVGGRALIDGDPIMVASDLGIDAEFFYWITRNQKRFERVLYTSSSAAYPIQLQSSEGAQSLSEDLIDFTDSLGKPDMTYGWSKLTGEYLALLAHKHYGIHIACVRPFSGYGEDQDLTYPTPSIALRVARGDDPIEVWGTGKQGRDFVHIDDCVDSFFPILDKVHDGRGVNIGTGSPTSFIEIIERMLAIEGRTAEIKKLTDKPVGVHTRYADTTFLTNSIQWAPQISLDEGLSRVLKGAHERLEGNELPYMIN